MTHQFIKHDFCITLTSIRKTSCLNENKKLLEVLLKEKKNLENKQEELENQKITELEEKLAKVKRLYGEMKMHLVLS